MLLVVIGVCLVGLIVYTYVFPRLWRSELRIDMFRPDAMPSSWWLGQALWQGYCRLGAVSLVGGWTLILATASFALAGGQDSGGYYVAGAVLGTAALLSVAAGCDGRAVQPPEIHRIPASARPSGGRSDVAQQDRHAPLSTTRRLNARNSLPRAR